MFGHSSLEITPSIISSINMGILFQISGFFHNDLGLLLFFLVFVVDLLQRIVVSSTVDFFYGFSLWQFKWKSFDSIESL